MEGSRAADVRRFIHFPQTGQRPTSAPAVGELGT